MSSILDRDVGRTITVTADKTPDYILITITVFLIIVFWLFLLYLVLSSPPRETPTTLLNCAPGQCGTNIYNGEKRCGNPGSVISVDPSLEVCNSPFTCDNPLTPFAVLPDGSTARNGVCPINIQCRCVGTARCAEYTTVLFTTASGNPYTSLQGTRTSFIQKSGPSVTTNGVISFSDPTLSFCSIPLSWTNRTTPGCGFAAEMGAREIKQCMQTIDACQQGTLAFIPSDPVAFKNNPASLLNLTPLACVRGTRCTGQNQIAYWNSDLGGVDCAVLP